VQLAGKRAQLSALVPELADPAGAATSADPADSLQERMRLFESVTALLAEVARLRGMVLLLDDLHWADTPTLLLLRHLVRGTAGAPLLVVGTYRKTEVAEKDPLTAALGELRRVRAVDEVALGGLDGGEVAQLVRAHSGDSAPEQFLRGLATQTEGNPFFIEEVLRNVEHGQWSIDEVGVPDSVKDLLLRRLRRLSENSRRTLATAAVAGREFEMVVLAPVLQLGEEELLLQLEEALEAQVVVEAAQSPGRYRFAHALIRETIYEQLSATRRALLHRRIAEAIESVLADRLDQQAGMLAYHYRAAGELEKAFSYHCRAADAAERVFARETSLEHLDAAIVAGELLGHKPEERRDIRELFWRRAKARGYGEFEQGMRDNTTALDSARTAGDRELEMHVLNGIGGLLHVRDAKGSISHHEQALAIAEELNDEAGRVSALNRLSLVYANQGEFAEAITLGERALQIAGATGDQDAVAKAMDSLKFAALQLGDVTRLEELAGELEPRQRQRGDIWFLQWTLLESSYVPMARADWSGAEQRLEEALALARRTFEPLSEALTLDAMRWLEQQRGRYGRAIELSAAAVERAPEPFGGWAGAGRAETMIDLMAAEEALEFGARAVAAAERYNARPQIFRALAPMIEGHLLQGGLEAAGKLAERAKQLQRSITTPPGMTFMWGIGTYLAIAHVELARGRAQHAHDLLAPLVDPVQRSGIAASRGSLAIAMGRALTALESPEPAQKALIAGLEAVANDGFQGWRWRLHAQLASLCDGAEARAHRDRANALVEEMAASVGGGPLADGLRAGATEVLDGSHQPGSSHSTSHRSSEGSEMDRPNFASRDSNWLA
jgi:tetratricopeptide (TPR) repeat protein